MTDENQNGIEAQLTEQFRQDKMDKEIEDDFDARYSCYLHTPSYIFLSPTSKFRQKGQQCKKKVGGVLFY